MTFDEPYQFANGVTLRNRVMMSPMTTLQSFFDGTITKDELAYYALRSQGVGAVITGAANVQASGKGWPGELSIASDDKLPELTQLASAIQNGGAKAIIQIFHGGRMSEPAALADRLPEAPSAIAAQHHDGTQKTGVPREMTTADVQATVAAFGAATRRAIQAGFDGIELHGANTYLFQQFFSPQSNHRTDQYGGGLAQRYTFIQEVLEAVFAAVKQYATAPFIVGYRFSPEEFTTPGITFEDTLYLIDQLVQTPLDYLHVSLNEYNRVAQSADYQAQSILAYLQTAIAGRKALVGVGGVRTRADANHVLAHADLVAVGQQLLVDPFWVQKLLAQHDDAIVTTDFETAIDDIDFTTPLYDFLVARYRSTPNM